VLRADTPLTVDECARIANVSHMAVVRWIRSGSLRVSKRWRRRIQLIRYSTLRAFLRARSKTVGRGVKQQVPRGPRDQAPGRKWFA